MRIVRVIAITLIGVLLILGACASPAPTPPRPAATPATPEDMPMPEPTTPMPAPTTPTPAPTTPTPAPTPPPPAPAPPTPAPTTPTGPAKFVTSNLRVTPLRVEPKDVATVTVTVRNTGGESGTYKVEMKVNGASTATKDVTLAGGASQDITFPYSNDKLGDYEITIDELSIKLIVEVF